jgi:hypothetical protein
MPSRDVNDRYQQQQLANVLAADPSLMQISLTPVLPMPPTMEFQLER